MLQCARELVYVRAAVPGHRGTRTDRRAGPGAALARQMPGY